MSKINFSEIHYSYPQNDEALQVIDRVLVGLSVYVSLFDSSSELAHYRKRVGEMETLEEAAVVEQTVLNDIGELEPLIGNEMSLLLSAVIELVQIDLKLAGQYVSRAKNQLRPTR